MTAFKSTGNPILDAALRKSAGARASKGGNRFRDGKYELTVLSYVVEAKSDGTYWIAEFVVDKADKVRDDVEPNPAGSSFSVLGNLTSNVSAPGNHNAFVVGLTGMPEAPDSEQDPIGFGEYQVALANAMGALITKAQPARGMRIKCESFRKPIKSDKDKAAAEGRPVKEYVGQNWTHVGGQTPDSIKARRAELDNRPAPAPAE